MAPGSTVVATFPSRRVDSYGRETFNILEMLESIWIQEI